MDALFYDCTHVYGCMSVDLLGILTTVYVRVVDVRIGIHHRPGRPVTYMICVGCMSVWPVIRVAKNGANFCRKILCYLRVIMSTVRFPGMLLWLFVDLKC